ncbi:MAG: STAS domain-containing protein [Candidatus Accumulibacter sp.]|nr:STAS domain-containing protein [Accumulibacter sp.]
MTSRPAVVPRPAGGSEEKQPPASADGQPEDENVQNASLDEDFSDFELSQTSPDFQVDEDIDPVDGPAEEAAVLFANNQDQAAQAILEDALKSPGSGAAERLWLMLFDLYRLSGQRSAFEAMGVDYAQAFEKSPPGWGIEAGPAPAAKVAKAKDGNVLFKGDLLGSNAAAFDAVRQALEKNQALRLDMSKVREIDPEGCAHLLEILAYAGKNKRHVDLRGRDALIALAQNGVEAGKKETPASGKECWRLLLELFQRQGRQEVFEELAIDYAVTFEESPPSWEAGRVMTSEPDAQETQDAAENDAADDDAYVLSGEVRSERFTELPAFAQTRDALLIDCAKLTRMDFVSAGALLNALTSVCGSGKQIIFRHPNHMVAELFRVVGLTGVAKVVFAWH